VTPATADARSTLYLHPKVLNSTFRNHSVIGIDAYALGVCLLEIGLWKPLASPDGTGLTDAFSKMTWRWLRSLSPRPRFGTRARALRDALRDSPLDEAGRKIRDAPADVLDAALPRLAEQPHVGRVLHLLPSRVWKDALVWAARGGYLAPFAGEAYAELVGFCLTWLDDEAPFEALDDFDKIVKLHTEFKGRVYGVFDEVNLGGGRV
jgi:hypothetical protein